MGFPASALSPKLADSIFQQPVRGQELDRDALGRSTLAGPLAGLLRRKVAFLHHLMPE